MADQIKAFRCTVCGYIHRGESSPDECPVCGSPESYFEAYTDPAVVKAENQLEARSWRCLVCNYEHKDENPPGECPVCGTPKEKFEAVSALDAPISTGEGKAEKIIVVGAGVAGVSAVESIRGVSSRSEITMISKDSHLPYYRLNLTRLLADEITLDNLPIHTETWYRENNINLMRGTEVIAVDPEKHELTINGGTSLSFDKLILTAGAHPFFPPIPGLRREGVTALRSMEDAEFILKSAESADSIVVIGGGILGLEAAGALARQSKKVTVLESFNWLMPRQLTEKAAFHLESHLKKLGVDLKVGANIQELTGDERVAGVVLKSGETIPADLVIVTSGVRSNSYLARLAGLIVNNGIVVDDHLLTSNPDIYAAGDVAEHRGTLYGLWNAAQYQGNIAGMNAAGQQAEFGGIPRSTSIKVLGVDLLSIGQFEPEDGSYVLIEEDNADSFTRFVFRDTHLVGAILFGRNDGSSEIKNAIENKTDFSQILRKRPSVQDIIDYVVG